MSVAPESGRNRIMIYGPKSDGEATCRVTIRSASRSTAADGLAINHERYRD